MEAIEFKFEAEMRFTVKSMELLESMMTVIYGTYTGETSSHVLDWDKKYINMIHRAEHSRDYQVYWLVWGYGAFMTDDYSKLTEMAQENPAFYLYAEISYNATAESFNLLLKKQDGYMRMENALARSLAKEQNY